MFLTLQHPFTDMRRFLGAESARLHRPLWPLAEAQKDFVRASGLVRFRRKGGLDEWAGEESYSDANRALTFPDHLRHLAIGNDHLGASIGHALRRYYSDGGLARLEVGLRFTPYSVTGNSSAFDRFRLLRELLELPVSVTGKGLRCETLGLVQAGDMLAQHYLFASTRVKASSQAWWFSAGAPSIVLDYDRLIDEHLIPLPPHISQVLELPDLEVTVSHAWLQIGKQQCAAWFIARGNRHREEVRKLRMHLTRLHTERECLRTVISHAQEGGKLDWVKQTERAETLQHYLNNAIRAIERPMRFGFEQSVLLSAAREAYGITLKGRTTSFDEMRQQVAMKVQNYLSRESKPTRIVNVFKEAVMTTTITLGNFTLTGGDLNIVTAKTIENSFNKATNSALEPGLKQTLENAVAEIAKMMVALPKERAELVSRDLETFTTEVTSEKPRQAWYELSAQGILEAAKTVADMAVPVTTAVAAVLALLK
ncbi:hypothetical protein [Pseudomonas sp. UFMG81]|uniref:hypothetical protein n=1 Tax=Pseudomonas sp. UFMG81 TaxID=2745936 RepID=UPI0018909998|nr:hypothetical protein [Pseudomonas sp. UFMG81]